MNLAARRVVFWSIQKRPPLIPIKESSLVIAGRVVSANAYLSNDKQGIYTEFSICVSEVLKADPLVQDLKKGGCVTADRPGGVVRMPTGQTMFLGTTDASAVSCSAR